MAQPKGGGRGEVLEAERLGTFFCSYGPNNIVLHFGFPSTQPPPPQTHSLGLRISDYVTAYLIQNRMFNHNKPLSRRPNKTEAGDKALITKIQDFQSKRHKGKPKQVHLTPQTDVNITDIKRIFSTTWRENKTNFMSIR